MAWIEVHQSLITHRKTIAAADQLNMQEVHLVGHLVTFWLWALDNAQDGQLLNVTPRMIARASLWTDSPDELVDALVTVGFLTRTDDGFTIHDWDDYAGRLIDRRTAERERSRQRRAASKSKDDQQTTGGQPADDQQTAVGTVPNPTVPINSLAADESPHVENPKRQRKPDAYFDQFISVFGFDLDVLNNVERGRINKACALVRESKGRPEEIPIAFERYRTRHPTWDRTPLAIASNWNALMRSNGHHGKSVEDEYPLAQANGEHR